MLTIDQWIAAIAAVTGVGAIIVSAVAIIVSLRDVRDQLRTTVFIAYTERYSKVMAQLPFEARSPRSGYRLEDVSSGERTLVLSAFREYFNLCSEEMWLRAAGRIDSGTWALWELGMKEVAQFPCFAEAWLRLSKEFAAFEQFTAFMHGIAAASIESHVDTDHNDV
jgi:hypothetical protein